MLQVVHVSGLASGPRLWQLQPADGTSVVAWFARQGHQIKQLGVLGVDGGSCFEIPAALVCASAWRAWRAPRGSSSVPMPLGSAQAWNLRPEAE